MYRLPYGNLPVRNSNQLAHIDSFHTRRLNQNVVAIISLASKVANSDGHITERKEKIIVKWLKDYLKFNGNDIHLYKNTFNSAKESTRNYEQYARHLQVVFLENKQALVSIICLLLDVAIINSKIGQQEDIIIKDVSIRKPID